MAASRGASSLHNPCEPVEAAASRTGESPPQSEEKFSSLTQQRIWWANMPSGTCTSARAIARPTTSGATGSCSWATPSGYGVLARCSAVVSSLARRALRSAYDEYLASMLRSDPPDLEAIATAANNQFELQHARVSVLCDARISPEQFTDTLGRIKAAGSAFLGCNCRSVVRDWAQHKPWCHGDSLRRALSDAQDEASDGPPLGDRTWVPVAGTSTPSGP